MDSLRRHVPGEELIPSARMTPGGFHSFEHRWALTEAFRFHMQIGKAKVAARIHELNRPCREGLAKMHHVKLQTPLPDKLSAEGSGRFVGLPSLGTSFLTIVRSLDPN